MKYLFVAGMLLVGCNSVTAQCQLELQVTDNPEAKYRAQKVCKADGYTGSLEKTLCRSKNRLEVNNLPTQCKD